MKEFIGHIKTPTFMFGVIAGILGFSATNYFQDRELRNSAEVARITATRKTILYLSFFREDLLHNIKLLKSPEKLNPTYKVRNLKSNRNEIIKEDPMLNVLYLLYRVVQEHKEDAVDFLNSELVNNPEDKYNVVDAKRSIEMFNLLEKAFNSYESVSIQHIPEERLRLSFSYNVTKEDILYDLPFETALEVKKLYSDLYYINNDLDKIAKLTSQRTTSDNVFRILFPITSDLNTLRSIQKDLNDKISRVPIVRLESILQNISGVISEKEKSVGANQA